MSGGHGQCCVSGFSMNLARTFSVARLSAKRLPSACSVRPAHGSRPHAGAMSASSRTLSWPLSGRVPSKILRFSGSTVRQMAIAFCPPTSTRPMPYFLEPF
jgi:hypothetical protein